MLTELWNSPLGEILLAAEDGALIGCWFAGQKYERAGLPGKEERETEADRQVLEQAAAWLRSYFEGGRPEIVFSLQPRGTVFQRRVWEELTKIPYGRTRSYGALAQALSSSPRAVGAAVGRNPVSLFIPCHRVVGADGALTGYAGGLERKRALLELEKG